MLTSPSKRVSVPWLALCAAALQCVALALITLLLVCPTPWESSSISLFTVQPAATAATTTTAIVPTRTSSVTSPTSTAARPVSTSTFNTTTPAIAVAQRRDYPPVAATQPNAAAAAMPVSYESTPSSGGLNATALNGTVVVGSTDSAQAHSDILLRVGALGVCYRSPIGVETCSSARLASQWSYTALQRVLDEAYQTQTKADNVTLSAPASLHDVMPRNLSTFATVLLSVIAVLACVAAAEVAYVVVLMCESKVVDGTTMAPLKHLASAPWPSMIRACHWLAGACAMTLVIASAIQKYKLSGVKDAFNAVSPASMAVAGFRGNPSLSTTSLLVSLTADTGNGFGFAWIATAALLVSAWLQRVALRRRIAAAAASALLPRSRSTDDDDKVSQFGVAVHQANPSQLSLSQPPPPTYGMDAKHLYRSPSSMTLASGAGSSIQQQQLPALRQAHEGNVRIDAKESPPFARYHQQQQTNARGTPYHTYPPPASLSRFAQPMPLSSPNVDDASEYFDDNQPHAGTRLRSTSPAPSYWTAPVPSSSSEWGPIDKQRERHYMAELRRQRSALSETH